MQEVALNEKQLAARRQRLERINKMLQEGYGTALTNSLLRAFGFVIVASAKFMPFVPYLVLGIGGLHAIITTEGWLSLAKTRDRLTREVQSGYGKVLATESVRGRIFIIYIPMFTAVTILILATIQFDESSLSVPVPQWWNHILTSLGYYD